jgi:two-component system response regulator AtoC
MSWQPPPSLSFEAICDERPEEVIFGCSELMHKVRGRLQKVATTSVPVLFRGETGTGKEVLAKFLHRISPWRDGPFVKVNCAAIPAALLESELFGYEKGAFTGAFEQKLGRVEHAQRGTLFLDEIAELNPALQAKLLQVLQDGCFSRVGGAEDRRVEVRIVCATNRNIEQEIAAGTFRQDLFYRINVVTVTVPPLRERREDIPGLAKYYCSTYASRFQKPLPGLSKDILQLLRHRDWPGNVRELENWIAGYVIFGSDEAVRAEFMGTEIELPENGPISLKDIAKQAAREMERLVIFKALRAERWNRRKAARFLNISYRALMYKIRDLGLPAKRGVEEFSGKPSASSPSRSTGTKSVTKTDKLGDAAA